MKYIIYILFFIIPITSYGQNVPRDMDGQVRVYSTLDGEIGWRLSNSSNSGMFDIDNNNQAWNVASYTVDQSTTRSLENNFFTRIEGVNLQYQLLGMNDNVTNPTGVFEVRLPSVGAGTTVQDHPRFRIDSGTGTIELFTQDKDNFAFKSFLQTNPTDETDFTIALGTTIGVNVNTPRLIGFNGSSDLIIWTDNLRSGGVPIGSALIYTGNDGAGNPIFDTGTIAGESLTSDNGITRTLDNFQLGGDLVANTIIGNNTSINTLSILTNNTRSLFGNNTIELESDVIKIIDSDGASDVTGYQLRSVTSDGEARWLPLIETIGEVNGNFSVDNIQFNTSNFTVTPNASGVNIELANSNRYRLKNDPNTNDNIMPNYSWSERLDGSIDLLLVQDIDTDNDDDYSDGTESEQLENFISGDEFNNVLVSPNDEGLYFQRRFALQSNFKYENTNVIANNTRSSFPFRTPFYLPSNDKIQLFSTSFSCDCDVSADGQVRVEDSSGNIIFTSTSLNQSSQPTGLPLMNAGDAYYLRLVNNTTGNVRNIFATFEIILVP